MISRYTSLQIKFALIAGGLVCYYGTWLLPYYIGLSKNGANIYRESPKIRAKSNEEVVDKDVVGGPKLEDDGFDSNHRPLTCQRQCSRRINKIYYWDTPAGLGDMKSKLHDLSQLAGYLCAEVVVAPPTKLLHEKHNFLQKISPSVAWSDLYNLTFIEDGNPVIQLTEAEFNKYYDSLKYEDWFYVVSSSKLKLEEDFKRVEAFSFQQDLDEESSHGFVWEIYKIDLSLTVGLPVDQQNPLLNNKMRPKIGLNQEGCTYTNSDTEPTHLKIMQKRLLTRFERMSPQNTIFGLLHLRRGDVIAKCDTSVDRMKEYLACSLNGTESLGRNLTLLMMTDEDDVEYRQDIMGLLDDYPHVSILDADDIVKKIIREGARNGIIDAGLENNFYVYDIEKVFQGWDSEFTKFFLVRRRSMCTDCIPVMERLGMTFDV